MDGTKFEAAVTSLTNGMAKVIDAQNSFRNEINALKENKSSGTSEKKGSADFNRSTYKQDDIANLERRWLELDQVIMNMAATLNDILQYMRLNNLLIHNLPGMSYDKVKDLKGTDFTKEVVKNLTI